MSRVQDMIREICRHPPPRMALRAMPDGVDARFQLTGRRQRVRFAIDGEHVVLTSIVLTSEFVTDDEDVWRDLVRAAWERNMLTDVVLFGFDAGHNLVGRVVHSQATLDSAELRFYLSTLLEECDRFEYVLTGDDRA